MLTNEQITNWTIWEEQNKHISDSKPQHPCLKQKYMEGISPLSYPVVLGLYCPCPMCSPWC